MTKPKTEATPGSGRTLTHVVSAGQTFYSVSRYYGVNVDALLEANGLTLEDRLAVGQKLTVPNVPAGYPSAQPVTGSAATQPVPDEPAASVATGPAYHTVAKGETLYSIAKQYNVTVEQLVEWNKLRDQTARLGQKLKVSE